MNATLAEASVPACAGVNCQPPCAAVPVVDLPVITSINWRQWDAEADFQIAGQQVWLSDVGKRKLIELYERRKEDHLKHLVIGYSLPCARLLELEVRLLEKE